MNKDTELRNRMAMERRMVRKLIRTAKAAGWAIPSVNDGEEIVKCASESNIMDAVFSVDESWIRFTKMFEGIKVAQVAFIVLGNDGWDCIADSSEQGNFVAEVIEPMNEYAERLCAA